MGYKKEKEMLQRMGSYLKDKEKLLTYDDLLTMIQPTLCDHQYWLRLKGADMYAKILKMKQDEPQENEQIAPKTRFTDEL